jgi:hypothetical protein
VYNCERIQHIVSEYMTRMHHWIPKYWIYRKQVTRMHDSAMTLDSQLRHWINHKKVTRMHESEEIQLIVMERLGSNVWFWRHYINRKRTTRKNDSQRIELIVSERRRFVRIVEYITRSQAIQFLVSECLECITPNEFN